ncbi:OsmC family protein [Ornithinimicrobium faecis]|uniref:OsmC family protein n=1 Tax=Ornithinimicrobium faecis TaxID=2934158 RepID=A0ABY4YYT8_9MICO|nr:MULTISPECIES: OsmC family protein [unclassified Ornithinimicrobium]USQ81694.1 OsmC family protein [Ornithinimicrobium sp. HY1793]
MSQATSTTAQTSTASQDTSVGEPQIIRPEVRTTLVTGTATEVTVQAGAHRYTIDEPAGLGGTDKGANPVEHLLGALGACQVITFQVWADKLGIAVEEIDIALTGELDLRGFFGIDPNVRPGFSSIDVAVQISGSETQERYEELVETVERHCPVLDSLGNQVPVRATFAIV